MPTEGAVLDPLITKEIQKGEHFGFGKKKKPDNNDEPEPEKNEIPLSLVDDEYKNTDINTLKPLKKIEVKKQKFGAEITEDYTPVIQKQFDYLSRTKRIEAETERVGKLQDIVNNMTLGTSAEGARVVIINKGSGSEAFVMPDGTIFISQALLNSLDTVDEVGGVLAHEINHLINQTFENKVNSGGNMLSGFGVGWLHEAVGDSGTPKLLEKAGLNSYGFANAIKKIAGSNRGTVHQAGLMRAAQAVGAHYGQHFATSNKAEQPLPQILRGEALKTNFELIVSMLKENKSTDLKEVLQRLHPNDFYKAFFKYYPNSYQVQGQINQEGIFSCNDIIRERLMLSGVDKGDIDIFLLGIQDDTSDVSIFNAFLDTPEKIVELASKIEDFDNRGQYKKLHEQLFMERTPDFSDNGAMKILSSLSKNMYDISLAPDGKGIPVTDDSLLDALKIISDIKYEQNNVNVSQKEAAIINVLESYIKIKSRAIPKEDDALFKQEIINFLQKAKDKNLPLHESYLGSSQLKLYLGDARFAMLNEAYIETGFVEEKGEEKFGNENIDRFFDRSSRGEIYFWEAESAHLLSYMRSYFDKKNLSDSERVPYIEYFFEKLNSFGKVSDIDNFLEDLEGIIVRPIPGEYKHLDKNVQEINRKLSRYTVAQAAGLAVFKENGPEFMEYMKKNMDTSEIDFASLSDMQLYRLGLGLMRVDRGRVATQVYGIGNGRVEFIKSVAITDYDTYFSLPLLSEIKKRNTSVDASTIKELDEYSQSFVRRLQNTRRSYDYFSESEDKNYPFYSDNLENVLVGRGIREGFSAILEKGIHPEEYDALFIFIDKYFPDSEEKNHFLRQINKSFLSKPDASLDAKIDYLEKYYDMVGVEGMSTVADQIKTFGEYKRFSGRMGKRLEEYLSGSALITKLAVGDNVTSYFTGNFRSLFATALSDEEKSKTMTQELAKQWTHRYLGRRVGEGGHIIYDKNQDKFILSEYGRKEFRTFSDGISSLKNLSPVQRFGIALKALVDTNGALTSEKSRGAMAQLVTEAIGAQTGFIQMTLEAGVKTADGEIAGFSLAHMMEPLLFRALDKDKVNIPDLFDNEEVLRSINGDVTLVPLREVLDVDAYKKALLSSTRDVTAYGTTYADKPNSYIAGETRKSDEEYHEVFRKLETMFPVTDEPLPLVQEIEGREPIDPSIEAVIGGVEATGALGTRALQLLRQTMRFSPAIDERLSQSFDARKGMDKLRFWHNLEILSEKDEAIKNFVENELIEVGDYLGGGSLFTTYEALAHGKDGLQEKIVVKMLDANAESFLGKYYVQAQRALDEVIEKAALLPNKRQARKIIQEARLGKVLVDLSQQWCLADINDQSFEKDDSEFSGVVEGFNRKMGKDVMKKPAVRFNNYYLKSESKAEGRTLNQALNDPGVSNEAKKESVKILADFFVHQLKGEPIGGDLLVHSDPHVGNYVVDLQESGVTMNVIDRSMYLKVSPEDLRILEPLLSGEEYSREFLPAFINRMLDVNKVRGLSRVTKQKDIYANLTMEYLKLRRSGNVDGMSLLRMLMTEFEKAQVEVPLSTRLMIRNITALKELMKDYNMKLEDVWNAS